MEMKLGSWNILVTKHLCTCENKNCKIFDQEDNVMRGCYKGMYFMFEKDMSNSEECNPKLAKLSGL